MNLRLKDKRILVTGGSKGIGRAICQGFLEEGAMVEFCARNVEQVARTQSDLSQYGSIKGSAVDVTDSAVLAAWVDEAAGRMGGIDCVVSNASALSVGAADENWQTGFDVDLMGTQHLITAAVPHLEKAVSQSGDASVLMISSTAAAETAGVNAYGAIKAAMLHLNKGMARQYAAGGIRFNSISPGTIYFAGGVWNGVEQSMPEVYQQALGRNPMGRMGAPEEVANAVVYLSSPLSSFTTGANLVIDGALTQRVNY
jgi:3-oxoacyl-[acyl-carrier protein] reductase